MSALLRFLRMDGSHTSQSAADEIERLEAENAALKAAMSQPVPLSEWQVMKAENEALKADAERYYYLRDHCSRAQFGKLIAVVAPSKWLPENQTTTEEDDRAIDEQNKGYE
jgi:hypothetical protein